MVVDFHVHCFPDELAPRAIPSLAACAGLEANTDGTVSGIKKSMEQAGVDCSVVLSIATKPSQTPVINKWAAEQNGHGIVAFGSVHPDNSDWKEQIHRAADMGLKGLKFHPDYQQFYVDDVRLYPLYEYALSLGMIIVFHAGVDIGLKPPYHCTPERLARMVESFKGGTIIAAHMGGFDSWDEVERHLVGSELYFDTSFSLDWLGAERFVRIVEDHGFGKILFGTDSPWAAQSKEIEKLKGLQLGRETEEAIFGANALRILKEEALIYGK